MATLPTVGGSNNTWGTELNTYLQVAHNAGGSLIGKLPVFNVKDDAYGALLDGSHDDTTNIQAAVTACQNAGGGIVVVPGLGKISNTITVNADGE